MRVLTNGVAASPEQPWLPGLAHAVAALSVWPVYGAAACVTGLLVATFTSFVVYLPVAALMLNGGRPIGVEDPAPSLSPRTQIIMLALWAGTAWLAAAGYAGLRTG